MKRKMQLVFLTAALVLLSATTAAPVSAQRSHDQGAPKWKTGMVRISGSVWAGDVRLKRGMYHVTHVAEGDRHVLVFKSVTLRAGYQDGLMWEGKEVARLECAVESVTKSHRNTKVTLGRTSAGERSIQSIQIAGEKVKHILLPKLSPV